MCFCAALSEEREPRKTASPETDDRWKARRTANEWKNEETTGESVAANYKGRDIGMFSDIVISEECLGSLPTVPHL